MTAFERLADNIVFRRHLCRRLVKTKRRAAVKDGRKADPLKGLRTPQHAEIVEMPVFVGDDIVQYHHPVQKRDGAANTERFTAVHKMLIDRNAVVLLLCL